MQNTALPTKTSDGFEKEQFFFHIFFLLRVREAYYTWLEILEVELIVPVLELGITLVDRLDQVVEKVMSAVRRFHEAQLKGNPKRKEHDNQ